MYRDCLAVYIIVMKQYYKQFYVLVTIEQSRLSLLVLLVGRGKCGKMYTYVQLPKLFQVTGLIREQSANPVAATGAKDQILPLFKAPLLKNTLIMAALFVFQQ